MGDEVTIMDVAEAAGVSPSTVSRVINDSAPVSESTRSKVVKAVDDLGYRPNKFAHALRKQTSEVFGVIVPDISNPFFSTLIRGAEDRFHENDLSLIICDTKGELDKEQRNVEMLIKERVDGAIVTSAEGEVDGIYRLFEEGIPVIAVDREPTSREITAVLTDDEGSGVQATQHLMEKGCRRIGFIRGPSGISTAEKRFAGYRKSLEESGKTFKPELVAQGDFTFEGGKRAFEELVRLNGREELPDGIVVANDMMAVGVIRKAEELGIEVPEDLAIVGFDDILLSRLINPPLTTVSAPTYEMGQIAVDFLLEKVEVDRDMANSRKKVLKTHLVERRSSQYGARRNGY
ncbi:LacI family DNA-binding transcriptional regulator [Candidatus Bipolaricaulota bacterium]|nr:LacI family DNA-binding transcriptional regulator [Candidatus Bipolaricaulota bacterium]